MMTSTSSERPHAVKLRKRQTLPNFRPSLLPLSPPSPLTTISLGVVGSTTAQKTSSPPPVTSPHAGQRGTSVRLSTATFATKTSSPTRSNATSSTQSGHRAARSTRPSTATSNIRNAGHVGRSLENISSRLSARCQSASSLSQHGGHGGLISRRSSSAASLTITISHPAGENRPRSCRRSSGGSPVNSPLRSDPGHRVSSSKLSSPASPVHLTPRAGHGHRVSSAGVPGQERLVPRGLQRRSSTRSFLFSPSPEGVRSPTTARSPVPQGAAPGRRDPKRMFYNAALMAVHSRRISGGSQRGRRESFGSQGRRSSHALMGHRRSSSERLAQFASVVNFVTLHHRVRSRHIQRLWSKVRLWTRIVGVLTSMLRRHAAAAMEDPASPFYSHTPGSLVTELMLPQVDRDHYMFFDPSHFKANRQRRMSQEVQRILTKSPNDRTVEEVNYVMIGLRNIPQLAVYPIRMQRNLAQFGEFQCYEAKRMILKQGHHPEGFYIILYGNVAVAVKNEETGFVNIVVELPRGESFGELSIVSGGARNSSVLTTTYTELLCVSETVYQTIFTGGVRNINDSDQTEFVCSLPFLRGWPVEKMWDKQFQHHFRFMYIQRNGVIMRNSNHNDWLVVVKSGSVTVLKKLVHSRPTVSSRTGQYRQPTASTAFHSFLSHARDYALWLTARSITLPPSLQLPDFRQEEEEEEEEGEVGEEEVGEEEVEEEEVEEEEDGVEEEIEEEEEGVAEDGENDTETYCDDNDGDEGDEEEDEEEEEEGEVEEEREEEEEVDESGDGEKGNGVKRRQKTVVLNVRPQTCDHCHGPRGPVSPRKAWSATHPTSGFSAFGLPKRTREKRAKIQMEADNGVAQTDRTKTKQGKTTRAASAAPRFVSAKRTLLDDLDASYLATDPPVTEADINPQFVHVQTLTKGDVFGLAPLVFPEQPGLCLVSNGAECLLIDRKFYLDHCPLHLTQRLKIEVSPYPSEAKLQEDLVTRVNWDVYKQAIRRQMWEKAPLRVTSLLL